MEREIDFAKNLRLALGIAGMSQAALADAVGVAPAVVWQWVNGRRPVPAHHAHRVAQLLNVNALNISESLVQAQAKGLPVSVDAERIPPMLSAYLDSTAPSEASEKGRSGDVAIDEFVISQTSSGDTTATHFVPTDRHLMLPARWTERRGLNPEKLRAMPMKGAAMSPVIENGDMVVVDVSDDKVIDGNVYAFVTAREGRIRRLRWRIDGSLAVISDNPDKARYPDEIVGPSDAESLMVLGRVIYRAGEL